MYGYESWTIKRLSAEELMLLNCFFFWRNKTFQSPLDNKEIKPIMPEGNQPWIFTGKFDAEAEAPLLWPLDIESWVIGKDPDYRKDWEMKEKGQHRMRWFYGIIDSMDINLSKLWDIVKDRESWHATVHAVAKSQTRLSDWSSMFPKARGCVISTRLAGTPKEAVLDSRPYCGQIQRHL